MECRNIREKLSEYIDDILPPQEKVTMDEHLKSCRECSTVLADLKKTVERVKNLESLEPPVWMTQKIMARVRAEARPGKSLFQRLFYPLYIKLPVGAIATIVIALTTLYIFRAIEPEIKLAKAPTEEAAPQLSLREGQPIQKEADKEKASPKPSQGRYDTKDIAPSKPVEQPVPLKKSESVRDGLEAPKAPEPVKQAELSQEQRTTAKASGDVSAPSVGGALAKKEVKGEAAPAAPRMKAMVDEKKESVRIIVHVEDVRLAQKEVERNISELGGRIVKKESYEDKNILTTEMDSGKLKEFFERLTSVGQVKKEKFDFEGTKGVVGIRVEIVKTLPQ